MSTASFTVTDSVAVLRLDDGKANALNLQTIPAALEALDGVAGSGARALVLTGRAGFFSGGLDLKALPKLDTAGKEAVLRQLGVLLERVFTFPVPTVAAVGGHAMAGGALLALACDVRLGIAGPARFAINEIAIGLPVPSFGLLVAQAALSPGRVTDLLLHARPIEHPEGATCGVFESVHAPEALLDAAVARAATLARLDGPAYHTTKMLLYRHEIERVRVSFEQEVGPFIRGLEAKLAAG